MAKNEKQVLENLPNPGVGRFWRITFNPKSFRSPITVALMEYQTEGRVLSRMIGMEHTVASEEKIIEVTNVVLKRVSDYQKFVGDYGNK